MLLSNSESRIIDLVKIYSPSREQAAQRLADARAKRIEIAISDMHNMDPGIIALAVEVVGVEFDHQITVARTALERPSI